MLNEEIMNLKDIISFFKITKSTLYEWIKKEKFPEPIKVGGRIFWERSIIEEYVKNLRAQTNGKSKETEKKLQEKIE